MFVADEIPRELRRVVEFLNGQMNPAEVIAIEVRQYVGPGMKTLVPRVIGQTAEVEARKGRRAPRGARRWDIESIVAELESNRSSAEARVARELHDWVLERGWRPTFGKGAVDGSFIPVLEPLAPSMSRSPCIARDGSKSSFSGSRARLSTMTTRNANSCVA